MLDRVQWTLPPDQVRTHKEKRGGDKVLHFMIAEAQRLYAQLKALGAGTTGRQWRSCLHRDCCWRHCHAVVTILLTEMLFVGPLARPLQVT